MTALKLSPYLTVKRGDAAIAFYRDAFGAREVFRMTDPTSGKLGHAELELGPDRLMISEEWPDFGALSPASVGGTPVTLHLAVGDVDAMTARAEAAGALVVRRPATQSFGERTAQINDPEGHRWMLSQQVAEMTPAQMQKAWEDEA